MKWFHLFSLSSKMVLGIKGVAVVLATLTVYYQDLIILGNEALRTGLMSHILAIPFMLAYLIYRKRKMLRAVVSFETPASKKRAIPRHEIVGIMLCLLAFSLYWHGSCTFYQLEFHMVSLPLFLAGTILILFNVQTLEVLAFPIAFLLFLTPPPIGLVYTASTLLSSIASVATYTILVRVGLPVELTNQYGSPALILQRPGSLPIPFVIGVASSGVYSLIWFTVFAVFAAYLVRGKTWQETSIFAAGFPLIYALNILRIIVIVLMGYQFGIGAPTEAFNLIGGWVLIFLGTFVLLSVSDKIFRIRIFSESSKLVQCARCNQRPEEKRDFCVSCGKLLKYASITISRRDLFKIAALLISAILILTIQVPVFDLTEGPVQVTIYSPSGKQESMEILPEIPGYRLQFVYRDKRFEEITGRDAALVYAYNPKNGSGTMILATIEIASSRSVLQGPGLITVPEHLGRSLNGTQVDLRDTQLLQNPPIIGRFFAFQQDNTENIQVFLYWYVIAQFKTNSTSERKYVRLSLMDFVNSPKDVAKIEEKLLPIGEAIASYWEPIKAWSFAALLVAQYGYIVIVIMMALLAIFLMVQVISLKEEKQLNLRMFNKISLPEETVILQAVHQAGIEGKPTTGAIASSYESLTRKSIDEDKLVETLKAAEEACLVKRAIISENDEPRLVWKSQIAFPDSKFYLQRIRELLGIAALILGMLFMFVVLIQIYWIMTSP